MILETIVSTLDADGTAHIAPMGAQETGDDLVIAPFSPSHTLNNLRRHGCAVANFTDDVRVFAGCLTGRRVWPLARAERIDGFRLRDALAHWEMEVVRADLDDLRPRFHCRVVHRASHAPFRGFNRAQMAVIEAAILVSRLHILPRDKIDADLAYLRVALDKTAGPREREAWEWLMEKIQGTTS